MIGRKTLFYSAALVGLALLGAGWTAARADSTYPRRPVRWVVPYTAGGATDDPYFETTERGRARSLPIPASELRSCARRLTCGEDGP